MLTTHASIADIASANHGVISSVQLAAAGIPGATRSRWVASGVLIRLGPRSLAVRGAPASWERALAGAIIDLDGRGFLAGRTSCRLLGLDGFHADSVEMLLPREHRNVVLSGRRALTSLPLDFGDTVTIGGFRCLNAERTILDAPLFDFSAAEIENAIDSAIRLRLVAEQRLRLRALARHRRGINGGRVLLDALVDTGGESRLERWMLRLVRQAGLPRPELQKTYRDGSRVLARVDMQFGDLVVEVCGHGTHSTRRQLQADEQRRTGLMRRGLRVVVFRYEDVRDRPDWVTAQLRALIDPALLAA